MGVAEPHFNIAFVSRGTNMLILKRVVSRETIYCGDMRGKVIGVDIGLWGGGICGCLCEIRVKIRCFI